MSDSKLSIKIGSVEFSGEGNQDWLASQLDKILDKVPELLKVRAIHPLSTTPPITPPGGGSLNLSMVSVAAKLKSNSGPDLAIAAAAYLKIVKGQPTFSREEISKNMKAATGYYKSSFGSNLTNTLVQLVKTDALTQSSENAYSLHVNKEANLNGILIS